MKRGYFEIGIYQGKTPANLGTLWRSAFQLGAAGIFLIGNRFKKHASDTTSAYRHIPLRQYTDNVAVAGSLIMYHRQYG